MGYALAGLDDSDGLLPPERRERERPDRGLTPSLADAFSDALPLEAWGAFAASDFGLAGRRRREDPAPLERRPSPEDSWDLSALLRFARPPDAVRRS